MEPLPNDTISEQYWFKVDMAIARAAHATPKPTTLNDEPLATTPEPWRKVFEAHAERTVLDTPEAADNTLNNWELATPMPGISGASPLQGMKRHVSVVPYDMQIGARIMYGLSEHAPASPPPSQLEVDEEFTATCPMVMVADQLRVIAPRCGLSQGRWVDPATDRTILRWSENGAGGLHFAVDSIVTGNGSVAFAEFNEGFSVSSYVFHLYNCLNVERFFVEEAIVKVDHMAESASSTVFDHDLVNSKEAIFYKYTVKRPDGTPVAATALFRLGQSAVNITKYGMDQFASSALIAVARREGHWQRDQWRECTATQRGWNLEFPAASGLDTVATVGDLRIASAAIINMMAYRTEGVGADGIEHAGQSAMYWSMFKAIFFVLLGLAAVFAVVVLIQKKAIDKKLRRLLFRFEQVALPKRAAKVRQPVLHPTY